MKKLIVIVGFLSFMNGVTLYAQGPLFQKLTHSPADCDRPPVINCPVDIWTYPGANPDPKVMGCATAKPGTPQCQQPIVEFQDRILSSGPCIGAKSIQRIWTATDPTDPALRSFCIQYIRLEDTLAPTFSNCPTDTSILTNNKCIGYFSWVMPAVSDQSGDFSVKSSHVNGNEFPIGTTIITITATDACGNVSQCSFNLTVISNCCTTPPNIICPNSYLTCTGESIDPVFAGFPIAEASSPICRKPIVVFRDSVVFDNKCIKNILRTWFASDPDNPSLISECFQSILLSDQEPPIIGCPPNITVESARNCRAIVSWRTPTVSDNCPGAVTVNSTHQSGDSFPLGETNVVFTVIDGCGNSSTCEFFITVTENCCDTIPLINCPNDFTTCPGAIPDPTISGFATSTSSGNCPLAVVSFSDHIIFNSTCSTRIERTWTARDTVTQFQNTCIQIISLVDVIPPSINCNNEIRIETDSDCLATVIWPVPTTTDNCLGFVSMVASRTQGERLPAGTYPVDYVATDECGNTSQCSFQIVVIENCCKSIPIISCPGVFSVCPGIIPDPSLSGFAIGTPGAPNCLTPVISFRDSVVNQTTCGGTLFRIWTATDPLFSQLNASCTQEIIFEDNIAPSIICPLNITVQSDPDCFARVNWTDPVLDDNCGGNISLISSHVKGSPIGLGITTVTLTATDACNNVSSCTFTITVNEFCCNLPPTIQCPDAYRTCPNGSIDPLFSGFAKGQKGHPSCEIPLVSFTDQTILDSRCITIIERTWTAQDPIYPSLKSSCTQLISREDTSAPRVVRCPPDITIDPAYDCIASASWVPPGFEDNCGIFSIISSHSSGSRFERGSTLVSYTAVDSCGHSASCSFTVTVTDNCCDRFPIINCPANYISCPGTSLDPTITGIATAVAGKISCLEPIVSFRDSIVTNGPCPGARKMFRIWVAQDPNLIELRTECYQLIELKDTEPPQFTNFPDDITIDAKGECEAVADWIIPTATDHCGMDRIISTLVPGEIVGPGITVVTYTAFDQCGLSTTDSFTISLLNTEVSVTCPPDLTIVQRDPYKTGAIVNWNLPEVSYCQECIDSLPGFIYMGELNGHRYFCSLNAEEWTTARLICEQMGGRLAVINSEDENNFLTSKLNGLTAWIGLTDERIEGRFEWADRSRLGFTAWYPGQPDNSGNQDYVELRPDATWNDEVGKAYREYICEIPCYELKQIAGPAIGTTVSCGEHFIQYEALKDEKRDTCSFLLTVKCDTADRYCRSKGENSSLMWINSVRLKNIQNTSGNNGGYAFFDQPCAEIASEEVIELCLEPGFLSAIYNLYYKIWIDFNGDFIFDPVTEELFHGYGNTGLCGTVKLPKGLPRKLTRMRVSMAFGSYPVSPCSPILFGEVEDYCIAMNGATDFGGDEKFQVSRVKTGILKDVMKHSSGISDQQNGDDDPTWDVIVFPNPGNDWIHILSSHGMISEYKVFDHQGKTIFQSTNARQAIELKSTHWPEGIYTIILVNNFGKQIYKRFTIQR